MISKKRVNVRLDPEQIEQLTQVSNKAGIERARPFFFIRTYYNRITNVMRSQCVRIIIFERNKIKNIKNKLIIHCKASNYKKCNSLHVRYVTGYIENNKSN